MAFTGWAGDDSILIIHRGKKDEVCSRAESKACREKMRREKMNDRHVSVSSVPFLSCSVTRENLILLCFF